MKQKTDQPEVAQIETKPLDPIEKVQADIIDLERQLDEAMARVNALAGAISYAKQLLGQLQPNIPDVETGENVGS